jgi:hypothetical protein
MNVNTFEAIHSITGNEITGEELETVTGGLTTQMNFGQKTLWINATADGYNFHWQNTYNTTMGPA